MIRVATIAGVATLLATPLAAAQEPPHMMTFAWARGDGADRCPTQAAMMSSVRERLGRDPFSLLSSTSAEASVDRVGDRWRARLLIRDAQGAVTLRRELEDAAESCDAIAGAVALSVTLALSPPPPGDPRPAVDAERAPPVQLAVPDAPTPRPPPAPTPRADRARTSLAFELSWGTLPDMAFGVAWRLDAPIAPRWVLYGSASLVPESRMRADARWSFGMTRATAGVCTRARPVDRVEVALCGGLSFGLVHVVPFGATPMEPGNYPWLAGQAEVNALARVVGPLFVAANASGAAVLVRSDFVASALVRTTIFEQSVLALALTFAVGVEL